MLKLPCYNSPKVIEKYMFGPLLKWHMRGTQREAHNKVMKNTDKPEVMHSFIFQKF